MCDSRAVISDGSRQVTLLVKVSSVQVDWRSLVFVILHARFKRNPNNLYIYWKLIKFKSPYNFMNFVKKNLLEILNKEARFTTKPKFGSFPCAN